MIVVGSFIALVFAWTVRPKYDDDEEENQTLSDLKRSDDLNDEFTKRLHELHSTKFGKPMIDPTKIKRNVVLLKDRQLTKRKKD